MRITFGAFGFHYPDWKGVFYPEDIPEDWYIDYYANEFQTVFLPNKDLQSNVSLLEMCIHELDDDFTLCIPDAQNYRQHAAELIANLDDPPGVLFCSEKLEHKYSAEELFIQEFEAEWLNPTQSKAIVLIISSNIPVDEQELKKLVQTIQSQWGKSENVFVFFKGDMFSISAIKSAQIISDLLTP